MGLEPDDRLNNGQLHTISAGSTNLFMICVKLNGYTSRLHTDVPLTSVLEAMEL